MWVEQTQTTIKVLQSLQRNIIILLFSTKNLAENNRKFKVYFDFVHSYQKFKQVNVLVCSYKL